MTKDATHVGLKIFKFCPCCGSKWDDREALLNDAAVKLIGYQVDFTTPDLGLLLFNHETPDCGTTFSLQAASFKDMYDGPVYEDRLTGGADCPGYCLYKSALEACPAACECDWVREIIQLLNN